MNEQGKQKLIILSGISGSGKTTIATDLCNKYEKHIRVNRDDLRKQLVGKLDQSYYKRKNLNNLEKQVTYLLFAQIRHLLQYGYTVIVDNTHLKEAYINELLTEFEHLVDVKLVFVDTDYSESLKRLINREVKPTLWEKLFGCKRIESFNFSYLTKQHLDFVKLKNKYPDDIYEFPVKSCKVTQDRSLVNTIICDLDGTLCLYGDRNPYDRDFENDELCISVYDVLRQWLNVNSDKVIVFFSGRSGKFRNQTEIFLTKHFDTSEYVLYMRDEKDQRKDTLIKEELFNKYILNKFYVDFVIDDRKQVKRLWEKLGIFVLDVNQNDKEF